MIRWRALGVVVLALCFLGAAYALWREAGGIPTGIAAAVAWLSLIVQVERLGYEVGLRAGDRAFDDAATDVDRG